MAARRLEERFDEETFEYGGREKPFSVTARIPSLRCTACGFRFYNDAAEQARHEAACRHLGVMTPDEIRALRKRYGSTQEAFAALTGLGVASLGRWERGQGIQNEASDVLLHLLTFPENVERLRRRQGEPDPPGSAVEVEGQRIGRYSWSRLNHLQVGRFAEYFAKMEFALYGFQLYSAEVDDRGIDFIVRYESGGFYEIQVKSIRGLNYVFLQKDKFPLRPDRLVAVVILIEDEPPKLYLIPALAWEAPNALLVSRDYEGKQSKPEWGLNLSAKNLPLLANFQFDTVVASLMQSSADPVAPATQPGK